MTLKALGKVLRDAFSTARRKPLTYVGLIAVPLVVALFGLLYVNVFMDPYEKMKELPVAVVNLDNGALVDGEPKNYGEELVTSILENDSALWTPEGPSLVEQGLENSDYYMAVVIPSDFSERIAAGQSTSPETANITFFSNMRKNFMLSTLSSKMEAALRETINERIGAQYVEALAEGLSEAKDGFSDAADGTTQLKEGSSKLVEGASALGAGLDDLAEGAASLSAGLEELEQKTAGEGETTLLGAALAVEEGTETLKSGISEAKRGAASIAERAEAMSGQLAQAETATRNVENSIANTITAWKNGSISAEAAMVSLERTMLPDAESHTLSNGIRQASSALGGSPTNSGNTTIALAAQNLEEGLAQAETKLGNAETSGTLIYGAHAIVSGIRSVGDAAGKAQAGGIAIAKGASNAQAATDALGNGVVQLDDGIDRLQEGLSDGYEALDESLSATPEEYGAYAVAPVEIENEVFGELGAFGYGFVPLFLTLCLWLGSLALFFVFDPFPSKNVRCAGRFAAVFGRWPLYLLLVALNVAAVTIGAMASEVPGVTNGEFILFLACIGFSFFCILQMLSLFDIPGKALAVIFLIVQMACCSGTFPAVLGEGATADVSAFLPFTYAVDGFRECMSGTNPSIALSDAGVLLLFALVSVILSIILYPIALKLKKKRDEETIKALTATPANPAHQKRNERHDALDGAYAPLLP